MNSDLQTHSINFDIALEKIMGPAIVLHVLAMTVWVGGMFFAYMALRPVAASRLEPPLRLSLWLGVFERFFPWVWAAVGTLLASGYWIIFAVYGGFANTMLHVHAMNGLGIIMMLIFVYIYFYPFRALSLAVTAGDWPAGGKQLALIRRLIGTNLIIGLVTAAIGSGGRYLLY